MLQISTGRFFKTNDTYTTTHRFVAYTNYRFPRRDVIDVGVGRILPCWDTYDSEVVSFVCELTERIEKNQGGDGPGLVVSVGAESMINDFLLIMAFTFQAIFTLEYEATRRLMSKKKEDSLNGESMEFSARYFRKRIEYDASHIERFRDFCDHLFGLKREVYEGILRSIRRYVTALYRANEDLDASYTMMVASIESLTQGFDNYESSWGDYESKARRDIDQALDGIDLGKANAIRDAIVRKEHLSAMRRFIGFTVSNIPDSYFRDDTDSVIGPASRSDVLEAVKSAYGLRSKYIHELVSLPKSLRVGWNFSEIIDDEGEIYFSMSGLARLSRSVIVAFATSQQAVDKEEYDYMANLPNVVRVKMAPRYWVGHAESLNAKNVMVYLSGHLAEYAAFISGREYAFSQMRSVLDKIEKIVKGFAKSSQKVPFVVLYIFYCSLFESLHERCNAFAEKYSDVQDVPAIENLLLYIFFVSEPQWSVQKSDSLMSSYIKKRRKRGSLSLDPLLETIIYLWMVERFWLVDPSRALVLISEAVENWPGNKNVRNYEQLLLNGAEAIPWESVLGLQFRNSQSSK